MTADQIRFDEPQADLQRLSARFGGHAYDLHRHETYAVGLTLWGAQSFHYRGALETSRGGQVMVIHPDEAHDGHAGVDQGFAYRMLYVDPASVSAALDGASPPFVPDVVADDPVLADLLARGLRRLPAAAGAAGGRRRGRAPGRAGWRRAATIARARGARATAHRAVARARDFLAAEAHRTVASEELEKSHRPRPLRAGPPLPRRDRHVAAPLPGRPAPGARAGDDRRRHGAVGGRGGDGLRRPEPPHAPLRRPLRPDARPLGRARPAAPRRLCLPCGSSGVMPISA